MIESSVDSLGLFLTYRYCSGFFVGQSCLISVRSRFFIYHVLGFLLYSPFVLQTNAVCSNGALSPESWTSGAPLSSYNITNERTSVDFVGASSVGDSQLSKLLHDFDDYDVNDLQSDKSDKSDKSYKEAPVVYPAQDDFEESSDWNPKDNFKYDGVYADSSNSSTDGSFNASSRNSFSSNDSTEFSPISLSKSADNQYIDNRLLDSYYVGYIFSSSDNLDSIAHAFHVSKDEIMSSLPNNSFDMFIAGTRFIVPVKHCAVGNKMQLSCKHIAGRNDVDESEFNKFNNYFSAYLRKNIYLLPILDSDRKIVIEGHSSNSSGVTVSYSEPLSLPAPVEKPSDTKDEDLEPDNFVALPLPRSPELFEVTAKVVNVPLPVRRSSVIDNKKQFAQKTQSTVSKTSQDRRINSSVSGLQDAKSTTSDKLVFISPLVASHISPVTSQDGNGKSDGVEMFAPAGSEVVTVLDGTVVYVGNDIAMFGKLIIVRHANKIVSIYGHNSSVMVRKDDKVRKGSVIGKIGMTPNVSSPRLYFAMRDNKRIVDPMLYIPS
ncbi:MAG: M23 family metallopeptidase [Alphaproteobacteria bacterium]|nr:M23 family metallopeptidase [Rickettsiales bacterium]